MTGEDSQKEENGWIYTFEKHLSSDLKLIMKEFECKI